MTRVPMMGFNPLPNPGLDAKMPAGLYRHGRDRRECRAPVADPARASRRSSRVRSQQKAAAAQADGRFEDEIVPIETNGERVEHDGCIRADTTAEGARRA